MILLTLFWLVRWWGIKLGLWSAVGPAEWVGDYWIRIGILVFAECGALAMAVAAWVQTRSNR
jgi:hypothetical protein